MPAEKAIIAHTNPESSIAEAYRALKTNIQLSNPGKNVKVIIITSAECGEGNTTTITNLAITFAQCGNKVLLVDANFRKPSIHEIFSLTNNTGLSTVILQKSSYKECISKSEISNLDILTTGLISQNPSEILSSTDMKVLIDNFKLDYDYIFIDTPPIAVVTDFALVSNLADGVILLVAARQTDVEKAQQAKEFLDKLNANILGVVLNKNK